MAPLSAVALLVLWEAAAQAHWIEVLFFPAPSRIGQTLINLALNGTLTQHLGATLTRVLIALIGGGLAGISLGWLIGWRPRARAAIEPFVSALHPLPKLALFPLFLVVLGIGEESKIAVVGISVLFPVLISTQAGVAQIDRNHWDVLTTLRASAYKTFVRLVVPGSLPMTLVGLKLGFNTAFILTIAVEMLTARVGLGALVWDSWNALRTAQLFAVLFALMGLGVAGNAFFTWAARRFIPWQTKESS